MTALRTPAHVQAEMDAWMARILAPLDELLAECRTLAADMFSDGTLPDRRERAR